MRDGGKRFKSNELEAAVHLFEEELASAEQESGATWHRTTLWHCIRILRSFRDSPEVF